MEVSGSAGWDPSIVLWHNTVAEGFLLIYDDFVDDVDDVDDDDGDDDDDDDDAPCNKCNCCLNLRVWGEVSNIF